MEVWDLYNKDRQVIGEHIRGNELPEEGFHLVVHVWIKNSEGKYLMTQRAAHRHSFPLIWECVGGSVIKGENSIQRLRFCLQSTEERLTENDTMTS